MPRTITNSMPLVIKKTSCKDQIGILILLYKVNRSLSIYPVQLLPSFLNSLPFPCLLLSNHCLKKNIGIEIISCKVNKILSIPRIVAAFYLNVGSISMFIATKPISYKNKIEIYIVLYKLKKVSSQSIPRIFVTGIVRFITLSMMFVIKPIPYENKIDKSKSCYKK